MGDFILSRSWIEVAEAAKYISQKLHQKVKSSDIFDMAVQGKIKVYAHFPKEVTLMSCHLESRQFYIEIDPLKSKESAFGLGVFSTTEPEDENGKPRMKIAVGVRYGEKSIVITKPKVEKKNGTVVTFSRISKVHGLQEILPIAGFSQLLSELAYGEDRYSEHREIENFFYLERGDCISVLAERDKKNKFVDREHIPIVNLLEHAKLVLKPDDIRTLLGSTDTQQPPAEPKKTDPRELASCHKLISTLLDMAGIDTSQPYKAAGLIDAHTRTKGFPTLSETKIVDLIESSISIRNKD